MAKKVIDLGKRYSSAFGRVAVSQGQSLQKVDFKNKTGLSNVYATSSGSFEEMTLKGNGFELLFASFLGNDSKTGKVFAPPPMMSFARTKKITATAIDDSDEDPTNDAEVVERYNSGKWEIDIQGLLIDMVNHQFPKSHLDVLNQVFEQNAVFEVEGDWFDALKIKSIYIESFSPAGVQGFEDTIQFSMKAYGIKPVEFFLKNK